MGCMVFPVILSLAFYVFGLRLYFYISYFVFVFSPCFNVLLYFSYYRGNPIESFVNHPGQGLCYI